MGTIGLIQVIDYYSKKGLVANLPAEKPPKEVTVEVQKALSWWSIRSWWHVPKSLVGVPSKFILMPTSCGFHFQFFICASAPFYHSFDKLGNCLNNFCFKWGKLFFGTNTEMIAAIHTWQNFICYLLPVGTSMHILPMTITEKIPSTAWFLLYCVQVLMCVELVLGWYVKLKWCLVVFALWGSLYP